jgi:hypothetical protein
VTERPAAQNSVAVDVRFEAQYVMPSEDDGEDRQRQRL